MAFLLECWSDGVMEHCSNLGFISFLLDHNTPVLQLRFFQENRSTLNQERKVTPPLELEGALSETPLPVSAPQLQPALFSSYTGYWGYVGQIVSKEPEPFGIIGDIK